MSLEKMKLLEPGRGGYYFPLWEYYFPLVSYFYFHFVIISLLDYFYYSSLFCLVVICVILSSQLNICAFVLMVVYSAL